LALTIAVSGASLHRAGHPGEAGVASALASQGVAVSISTAVRRTDLLRAVDPSKALFAGALSCVVVANTVLRLRRIDGVGAVVRTTSLSTCAVLPRPALLAGTGFRAGAAYPVARAGEARLCRTRARPCSSLGQRLGSHLRLGRGRHLRRRCDTCPLAQSYPALGVVIHHVALA